MSQIESHLVCTTNGVQKLEDKIKHIRDGTAANIQIIDNKNTKPNIIVHFDDGTYLEHWGVKGMKWGVRNALSSVGKKLKSKLSKTNIKAAGSEAVSKVMSSLKNKGNSLLIKLVLETKLI